MENAKIAKTRITNIEQLQPGDVILAIWRKGLEKNKQSDNPLPTINYRQVCVVTQIEKLSDGEFVFHHRRPTNLRSQNGAHKIVEKSIGFNAYRDNPETACTTSTFGANHRIKGYEIWKLDGITSTPDTFQPMPNLKGNPAFDLMM